MKRFVFCMVFVLQSWRLLGVDLRGDTLQISSYQLYFDFRDFDARVLHGSATIRVTALQDGAHGIELDLLRLGVDSLKLNGKSYSFSYNDSVLSVSFPKLLYKGDSVIIQVSYHGKPAILPGDFGGFYWDEKYAFNIGVSFISSPHSYGRAWFPCFDNFENRSRYEFFITTRKKEKAFCNGLLKDVRADSISYTWHWQLNENIPAYLASVAVADYETLRDTVHGINGMIPVEIAALAEDTTMLKKRFNHFHDAFHLLEKYWGPYRWERVGYCIVPFQEGAMEHATNIAFMQNYLYLFSKECETTMAHELSHHWFGNLVTCATEPDMWLNEGWASYSQSLFIEGLYGADSARKYRSDGHLNEVLYSHSNDNGYWSLSSIPTKYTYGTTVYQKGADVIQTLRYYMGDSVFFNCMRAYLNRYAFKTATTDSLAEFLSQCSGKDMTGFFKQWVKLPGYPHFSISNTSINYRNGKYEVTLGIKQRLNHAPSFFKGVPLCVSYFDNRMQHRNEVMYASGENCIYSTALNFKPAFIALDLDENLAQATSRETKIMRDTGLYEFTNAMMSIQVQGIKDSSLISCVQNWLPAEPMLKKGFSLHLSSTRYWTVDGIFDLKMKAAGIFEYSGIPSDHLDAGFITHADSLVLMYRPNAETDWQIANTLVEGKAVIDSDLTGAMVAYPLKKGDYALAQYDASRLVEWRSPDSIQPLFKDFRNRLDFKMLVDNSGEVEIEYRKNIFDNVEISDDQGKVLMAQNITRLQNRTNLKLPAITNGAYIVTLSSNSGIRMSKRLNKK